MSDPIDNRLTGGPYEGWMVKEVPNDYLRTLALNEGVERWEPDIHAEVLRLCKERGIALASPRAGNPRTEELLDALEMGFNRLYRQYALQIHPDRLPAPDEAMKALNGFWDEMKAMLRELRGKKEEERL